MDMRVTFNLLNYKGLLDRVDVWRRGRGAKGSFLGRALFCRRKSESLSAIDLACSDG